MAFGFSATSFLISRPVEACRGGCPRPVKMIFDQYAFTCAGDLPVYCA